MTVVLVPYGESWAFGVKAMPGARRNGVCGEHDGCLKVAVSQPPEKGKANAAIVDVVAAALGVARRQVAIVAGETNARKKLCVSGIEADELARRLAAAVAGEA